MLQSELAGGLHPLGSFLPERPFFSLAVNQGGVCSASIRSYRFARGEVVKKLVVGSRAQACKKGRQKVSASRR